MSNTNARTDIHRPSAPEFDPQDYTCHGVFDTHPEEGDNRARILVVRDLIAKGYRFDSGSHQCGHCGQTIRYAALMVHVSKRMIYVGETCLDNRFDALTKGEFQELRAAAKLSRALALTRMAFEIACDENQALAYATYARNIEAGAPEDTFSAWALDTLADIAVKARRYGSATEGQLTLVERIVGELEGKETAANERRAARAAEDAARVDAFIGTEGEKKHQFDGVVRFVTGFETQYGWTTIVVIDTAEGTAKWKTSSATDLDKGDKVSFTATIKAHEIYNGERQSVVLRPKFA